MHQLYDNISKVLICTYTENHVNMSVVKSINKKGNRLIRECLNISYPTYLSLVFLKLDYLNFNQNYTLEHFKG